MIGQTLGHYGIVERIGSGGMGVVYRARDARLDRDVALKVLPDGTLATDADRRRFRREALALSRLSHPNIATIHDFDTQAGVDFLVMEFISGAALSEKCAGGPMPEREVARLGAQLAEGLAAAHAQGVVHRDLKPANVRVTPDGRLKILDFGVARLVAGGDAETHTATDTTRVPGTLPYMAPEQIRGETADARTDIFAAGAVLFEMATGRRAFPARQDALLVNSILNDPSPPPSSVNRRVTPALDTIIVKALDKEPERRYQSASELAVDLVRVGSPTTVSAVIRRAPRRIRRLRQAMAGVALAAAAVVAGAVFWRTPPPPPFQERDRALIADFDNQAGDPVLDQAVREGLHIALEQSRYVNVVSRQQAFDALRRMQRPDVTRIDESVGAEICQREDIQVLLAGGIQRSGTVTQIRVRALQPATAQLLFAETVQFERPEDLFDRVDALARRVRRRLGESEGRIDQNSRPLARVTTPSLQALQQYSQAVDARARGDMEAFPDLLRGALALDPEFAMAHLRLARFYATVQGDIEVAREHFARAYDLRAAVSPREALVIEAGYHAAQHQPGKAAESLRTLVSLYPDDAEARGQLASTLLDLGDLTGAAEQQREVVRLNRLDVVARGNLVLYLARANQNFEAITAFEAAQAEGISSPYLRWGLGLANLGLGRTDGARAAFQQLLDAGGRTRSLGQHYVAQVAVYEGRLAEAARLLDEGIQLDRQDGNRTNELVKRYLLARVSLLRSEPERARQEAAAIAGAPDADLQGLNLYRLGELYAELGSIAEARDARAKLQTLATANPTLFNQANLACLDGRIALASGDPGRALDAFRSALAARPIYDALLGQARAFDLRGEWGSAAQAWREVIALEGSILHAGFPADWVLAHLGLSRALRAAGDEAGARAAYETFRTVWANADDLPVVAAAEREASGDDRR